MQKRNNVQIVTRLSYQASNRSNEHDHPNSDSSPTSAGHGLIALDCVPKRVGFVVSLVVLWWSAVSR